MIINERSKSGLNKASHIYLWVAQFLVGGLFAMTGFMKAFAPLEYLHENMIWTLDVSPTLVRFIGLSELAGAMALLLPGIARLFPVLSALAATGLTTIMVLAIGFHSFRGEYSIIPVNIVLGLLGLLVGWGSLKNSKENPPK